MKKMNILRMSVAMVLLITLPIFLSGCAGLTAVLAGLSKIFEGAKMLVDGISTAIGSFGKDSTTGSSKNSTTPVDTKKSDQKMGNALGTAYRQPTDTNAAPGVIQDQ
ncbi:MAG: hypothetical protein WA705_05465 [Candidatus Ozemobacteraceae bacterium]